MLVYSRSDVQGVGWTDSSFAKKGAGYPSGQQCGFGWQVNHSLRYGTVTVGESGAGGAY